MSSLKGGLKKLNKNYISEYVRLKLRKNYIKLSRIKRSNLIKNKDFTIISNNCWGGIIYQSYNLPYNSPTVGMYIMPDDYIKMLSKLEYYLSLDLKFIKPNESKYYGQLKEKESFGIHPIGILDDVELMLLHYHSEEEAYEKWKRRRKRVNMNKLIVKFNDQNMCKYEHIVKFDNMDFKNKVFFSSKLYTEIKSEVYIKSARKEKSVPASLEPFGKSKYININELINNL